MIYVWQIYAMDNIGESFSTFLHLEEHAPRVIIRRRYVLSDYLARELEMENIVSSTGWFTYL